MGQKFFAKTSTIIKILKIKALQAKGKSSQIYYKHILKSCICLKRASLWLPVRGSVTVEASIAIPIFLFFFLEVISLLNYLSIYSENMYTLKNIGDTVSAYGYVYNELTEEIKTKEMALPGIYINEKEDTVLLTKSYTVKPIVRLTNTELHLTNRYYAKLWTGYTNQKESVTEYVYVTENRSVYHLYKECTHLKLSIKSIYSSEIFERRNDYGEKYKECSLCTDKTVKTDKYYITNQGNKYHQDISCSGLKRTIYYVEKKDVMDIPLCSRCNEKEGGKS